MYGRDKEVEKTEIFERLLAGLDKLIEVVSKDETSRGILDSLKERGAKELKEIPAADNRAEEIRTRRPAAPGLGGSSGSNFDFSTMSRLNTAFRALSGDLGAFQRNLGNAVVWSQKASQAYKAASTYTADSVLPKRQEYRKATDEEIAKAMQDAAAKGLNGNQMMQVAADLAKKGVPIEGKPSDDMAEKAHKATKTGTPVNVAPKPGSAIANASGGLDVAALARIAGTVALAAAPVVLGRMAIRLSDNAIGETRSRFGTLSGEIATNLARYDMSKLVNDLNMAPKISASFKRVLDSREEFNKTLQPIEILSTNAWNNLVTGITKVANFVLKPFSEAATPGWKPIWEQLGGLQSDFNITKPGQFKNSGLASILNDIDTGPAFGETSDIAAIGLRLIMQKISREKRLSEIDKLTAATPAGQLALDIKRANLCPPQRFVP